MVNEGFGPKIIILGFHLLFGKSNPTQHIVFEYRIYSLSAISSSSKIYNDNRNC